MRRVAVHFWPADQNAPAYAAWTAASSRVRARSAGCGRRARAARACRERAALLAHAVPTGTEPVNEIARTRGSVDGARHADLGAAADHDVEHARWKLGFVGALRASAVRSAARPGRASAPRCCRTRARAPAFQAGIAAGKFHGVISPTTPSGRRRVYTGRRSPNARTSRPSGRQPSPAKNRKIAAARGRLQAATRAGACPSRASCPARSPRRALRSPPRRGEERASRAAGNAARYRARADSRLDRGGDVLGAGARETRPRPPDGRQGLRRSYVRPPALALHRPAMKFLASSTVVVSDIGAALLSFVRLRSLSHRAAQNDDTRDADLNHVPRRQPDIVGRHDARCGSGTTPSPPTARPRRRRSSHAADMSGSAPSMPRPETSVAVTADRHRLAVAAWRPTEAEIADIPFTEAKRAQESLRVLVRPSEPLLAPLGVGISIP